MVEISPTGQADIGGELTNTERSLLYANGAPSADMLTRMRYGQPGNGRWRGGPPLDGFAQSMFFAAIDGKVGQTFPFAAATWTQATRHLESPGAFAGMDFNSDAFFNPTEADGGWTVGLRTYRVDPLAPNDDDNLYLAEFEEDLSTLIAYPADNVLTTGYAGIGVYLEPLMPVGAIVGGAVNQNFPADVDADINQSYFWDYPVMFNPGDHTNGGRFYWSAGGRIKLAKLASRPFSANPEGRYDTLGKVWVRLVFDPWSFPGVVDGGSTEAVYRPNIAARLGWDPATKFTAVTFESGTAVDPLGGPALTDKLRAVFTAHNVNDGMVVHLCSDGAGALPANIEEGQGVYVQQGTANKFFLSRDTQGYDLIDFVGPGDASATAIVSQGSQGSRHRFEFLFEVSEAVLAAQGYDQADVEEFCDLLFEVWGRADGRTVGTEEGTRMRARMSIVPFGETVGLFTRNATTKPAFALDTAITRTTPGRSADFDVGGLPATAAPLVLATETYYVDSDSISFTDAVAKDAAGGGLAANSLSHASFRGLRVNDPLTLSADGGSGLPTGTVYVKTKPAGVFGTQITVAATVGGPILNVTADSSTVEGATTGQHFAAGYSTLWDYGGNYAKVHYDGKLLPDPIGGTGEVGVPLRSYQLNDVAEYAANAKNSQQYRDATRTLMVLASQHDTVLGDVLYHDEMRGVLFVRPLRDDFFLTPETEFALLTYRMEKAGGTGAWSLNPTPVQTLEFFDGTGTALHAATIELPPQKILMAVRFGISGPPDEECEIEINTYDEQFLVLGSR